MDMTDTHILEALAAQARELAALRERLAVLPSFASTEALLDDLAGRTMDRVDRLMAIHRDAIEREIDVMRDAIVNGADVLTGAAGPVARADPPARKDIIFDENLVLARGLVDIQDGHGLVSEPVEIAAPVGPGQIIVAQGVGAASTADLLAWQICAGDAPCLGRYEIWDDGRWRFIGQVAQLPSDDDGWAAGLRIAPTGAYIGGATGGSLLRIGKIRFARPTRAEPAPLGALLRIGRIILHDALVQAGDPDDLPQAMGQHVGGRINGSGWHGREIGGGGAYRWMGARGDIRVDLKPGVARRLTIIGEDSVPHGVAPDEALRLVAGGQALPLTVSRIGKGWQRWIATADVPAALGGPDVLFELIPAPGVARSPRDYAAVDDSRILSFSVRAIAWDAVTTA